jgi:pimeloyl-ACP methyl ester carboxylesterase
MEMKKTMGIDWKMSAKLDFRFILTSVILLMGFFHGQARGESNELYRTEEITVPAGDFTVVGDLYIPVKGARHPLVVWVHGSGPLTRQMMEPLLMPQIEVFLKAGFAFFIDDIPGAGSSKGAISHVYRYRAMILCKEVEALERRPDIVPGQVGVAGHSQAGVVMPLALKSSCGIAFMIAEACVAESNTEQESYLLEKFMICENYPPEEAQKARRLNLQRYYAENYKDYREAAEYINNHPAAQLLEITEPLIAEDEFTPPDKSAGTFLDPMGIVAETRIPVLALFGEKDNNVDPVQGVEAYEKVLKAAGNEFYRVETIPAANHMLYATQAGCARELMVQIQKGKPDFAPGTLTVLADWLEKLKKHL